MIRIFRYATIILFGAALTANLLPSSRIVLPASAALFTLAWLLLGTRFSIISLISLPLGTVFIVIGYIWGGSVPYQSLLFFALLAAFETDSLYRDTRGRSFPDGQMKILLQLYFRELIFLGFTALIYWALGNRRLEVGFWPLASLVLFLIIILKKLFSASGDDSV